MLDPYIPNVLRQQLAAQTSDSERIDESISGAVLFADIAGYTKITEKLGLAGADGAERMLALLDQHFERVTSIILAHGGDVQLFAGDAALALWPVESDLESAIHAAAQCALAIRDSLHHRGPVDGITLTLRAGIGAGPLRLLEVGGYEGNRFALLEGEPITQAGDASEEGAPGDVVLSPLAAASLGQRAQYTDVRNGHSILASVAAMDIQPTVLVTGVSPAVLEDFVPQIVRERLRAGHQEWLAEFRRASILFVDLSARNLDSTGEAIRRDIYELQKITARYGGLVYQILMDDKGLTFVAAFGLPSLSSEHAPVRAVEAATAMRQSLESTGVPCAIGVATGRTFCGASGGHQRRQYSVFGSAINLASRLMQTSNGTVLVDDSTQQQAGAKIAFERCGVRQLKGFDQSVDLYTPASQGSADNRQQVQRLVGRKSESATIADKISEVRQGRGAIVWIEGEAGIGKSHFVRGLIASAEDQGVAVYSGEGDAIENVTSLFGWRRILSAMLGLSSDNAPEARSMVKQMLADDVDLLQRVSLLNEVLPLDFPETEESQATRGEQRADWIQSLVAKIVETVSASNPVMITIDDAHWLDSGSFELFASITRRCNQVLLLMASRPLEEPAATVARRMLDAPRGEKLILDRFSIEDLDRLLAYWLSVRAVPAALTSFVMQRAEGHPFHSEEILTELLESGAIVIDGDVCRITTGDGNLLSVRIPDSVQGVVASRIDRLPVVEQLMLKAASVVGRTFAFDLLRDIYPVSEDAKKLDQGLEHLEAVDLVRLVATEPTRNYVFKHAIVRDVAYETLPFERRRSLHRSVADWYEIHRGDKTGALAPLLSHHWDIAGEPVKAVPYLEQAGQDAVESFSNREAIGFLERARSLTSEHQLAVADLRVANWESLLGEAHI